MATALKHGPTRAAMKAGIARGRRRGREASCGAIIQVILGPSMRIRSTEKAYTHGQMGELTMANGKTTRCMVKVYSSGLTAVTIKESTSTIRSMGLENSIGRIRGHIEGIGRTGSNMGEEHISRRMALSALASGKSGTERTGTTRIHNPKTEFLNSIGKVITKAETTANQLNSFLISRFHEFKTK